MILQRKSFAILICPIILTACLMPVTFDSGNSRYVTYRVPSIDQIGDAARMANSYCAEYNKEAVPQVDAAPDGLRTFDCK
jgi:hypothetical protein